MKKYVCSVCGYVYDEAVGVPDKGIAPGTGWESLPADWVCPWCGASKAEFREQGAESPKAAPAAPREQVLADDRGLSALEVSILCSNLARGCEKQYMQRQAALFTGLADYFKAGAAPSDIGDFSMLLPLIEQDLEGGMPHANAVSAEDRGALRALVWSEKVTRILKSLLARYEREGDAMLEHTGIYVCTICGFVFVGDEPPALCPVCKVPGWKFEKAEGR